MTVVLDLGCHYHPDHPDDESRRRLIEWHRPPKAPRDWAVRRGLILDAIRCPVEPWR